MRYKKMEIQCRWFENEKTPTLMTRLGPATYVSCDKWCTGALVNFNFVQPCESQLRLSVQAQRAGKLWLSWHITGKVRAMHNG